MRDAATNTDNRGLPVIMVNTSPTICVTVLTEPVIAAIPVTESCGHASFLKKSWLRVLESNQHLQVQSLTCCHYTNPRYKSWKAFSMH